MKPIKKYKEDDLPGKILTMIIGIYFGGDIGSIQKPNRNSLKLNTPRL